MGRTVAHPVAASAFVVALLLTGRACADDASIVASYFERLRGRALFGLAERYGLDRRAELPRESAESIQLAVELSRTFADHSRWAATADEQAFLQTRADEALDDYRGNEPWPRIEAVTLERTYRAIDRAELAWWKATADPDDAVVRKTASGELAKSEAALADWIESAIESASRPAADRRPEELTRRELAVLIHAARLKSIDLLLLAAELSVSPPDKSRLIGQAEDSIRRIKGSAERGTTAAMTGYSVRIARLLGDEIELNKQVRRALADGMPLAIRQDAISEQARFELDRGHYEAAARLLVESKETLGTINDRLRAMHVEAVLGMSRSAESQRGQLLATAESELARVAGPWRLRSESLLQEARQIEKYGEQAARLVQRGNREFRGGGRDEATATFRQAAEAAVVPTGRAELRFMTASLLVEAERFPEAIDECERVTQDAPSKEFAARASLLTAYCYGRISARTGIADDRAKYEETLIEHLARFPGDDTQGDAAWMLSTLALQEGRLALIVEADRQMPEKHARAADSLTRAVEGVLKAQEELRITGGASIDSRDAAAWDKDARRLASRLLESGGEEFGSARRMLMAARLLAAVSKPDFQSVLAILNRIPLPAAKEPSTPDWQQLAHDVAALRLICLTATGQFEDAAATLQQLRSVSKEEMLDVLSRMSAAARQLSGPRRAELATLEIKTIERIRFQGQDLTPGDRQLLAECEAEARLALGEYAQAIVMFDEAASGKAEVRPRLADALEKRGRPDDLERARELWLEQIALHKQGTAAWFQASLRLARVWFRLGEAAECRKLIARTRIVYPELGGPDLKRAFEDLDRQAAAKTGR